MAVRIDFIGIFVTILISILAIWLTNRSMDKFFSSINESTKKDTYKMNKSNKHILSKCKKDPKFAHRYELYSKALNNALFLYKFRTQTMHMTQAQLAKKTDIPKSTISKIENGDMNPSNALLRKIAKSCHQPLK